MYTQNYSVHVRSINTCDLHLTGGGRWRARGRKGKRTENLVRVAASNAAGHGLSRFSTRHGRLYYDHYLYVVCDFVQVWDVSRLRGVVQEGRLRDLQREEE